MFYFVLFIIIIFVLISFFKSEDKVQGDKVLKESISNMTTVGDNPLV